MSQAGIINVAGGGGGGSPVQTLTGNSGGAVPPTANNINVVGDANASVSNVTGTSTSVGNPGASTITWSSYGYIGAGSTVGAVTADLITLGLGAAAGAYHIVAQVVGFESTGPSGTAYWTLGAVKTTGVAATEIGTQQETYVEDAALAATDLDIVASGNNVIVRVTGVVGLTIDWRATLNYIRVG